MNEEEDLYDAVAQFRADHPEPLSDPPMAYVTQEMWDRAQAALRGARDLLEGITVLQKLGSNSPVPPQAVEEVREQIRAAIVGSSV